jgi:SAM-dependent methyltransferase
MPLTPINRGGVPLSRHTLTLWLRSIRGRRLLALEEAEVRRLLPEIFGRHVLQVGSWGHGGQLVACAETLHKAVLGTVNGEPAAALIDPEHLPLLSKSVDAVLLPHTLEFSASPHTVLREVNRVLNDRGRLFVLGFNPWSGWALRNRLGLRHRAFPAGARFHSVGRLHDWLALLDFEVVEVRRYGVGFPWLSPRTEGAPWSLGSLMAPFAEAYLLMARKRVIPISLVGRTRRAQIKPLVGVGAPAAQSQSSFEKTPTT